MESMILMPKYGKNKKPVKKRKPSKPIDGINRRLLREQAVVIEISAPVDDNAPPSRLELETKAKELNLGFNKRTSDETLLARITEALQGE